MKIRIIPEYGKTYGPKDEALMDKLSKLGVKFKEYRPNPDIFWVTTSCLSATLDRPGEKPEARMEVVSYSDTFVHLETIAELVQVARGIAEAGADVRFDCEALELNLNDAYYR